jgi:hypothetical protein
VEGEPDQDGVQGHQPCQQAETHHVETDKQGNCLRGTDRCTHPSLRLLTPFVPGLPTVFHGQGTAPSAGKTPRRSRSVRPGANTEL